LMNLLGQAFDANKIKRIEPFRQMIARYIESAHFDINRFSEFVRLLCIAAPGHCYLERILEFVTVERVHWLDKNFQLEITDGEEMAAYLLYKRGAMNALHSCEVVLNEKQEMRIIKSQSISALYCFFDIERDSFHDRMLELV
jgi:hypothetical protein